MTLGLATGCGDLEKTRKGRRRRKGDSPLSATQAGRPPPVDRTNKTPPQGRAVLGGFEAEEIWRRSRTPGNGSPNRQTGGSRSAQTGNPPATAGTPTRCSSCRSRVLENACGMPQSPRNTRSITWSNTMRRAGYSDAVGLGTNPEPTHGNQPRTCLIARCGHIFAVSAYRPPTALNIRAGRIETAGMPTGYAASVKATLLRSEWPIQKSKKPFM